ncbi:MAG TPA: NAD-glutamate dehydrogenase [Stellaceae bacterium]|nr:NAD-glutamate dehydrogenase [Stellaceae bacterium]
MSLRADEQKRERIEGVLGRVGERFAPDRAQPIQRFVNQFYGHVPPEDVVPRGADDLYGAALSLWQFAQERAPGRAKLRAFNPRLDAEGWRAGRTVIEIVNDDMPFLVDSVTAALNGLGLTVHLVIHPILRVARDAKGKLTGLLDAEATDGAGGNGAAQALRESAMHVEASEQTDPKRLAEIAATLERVLADVRASVTDWRPMLDRLKAVRESVLEAKSLPLPPEVIAEGAEFLAWLEDDNFTFLGFREYRFTPTGDAIGVGIVAGSGLGILRDDTYPVFDGLRSFKTLAPEVQEFLRQPRVLSIAKSNRRATVHRPGLMDTIGVRVFGPDGGVVGERLFVGLFTSLSYSRSPRAIPLLRRKVDHILQRAGFPPQSHDAKALMHILDTYPRDELLQISDDQLYDAALGILNLQERQRIALFVRRDVFSRFASCLIYVPRERYNTELRQRFAQILENAFQGTISNFATELGESVLARVHYIVTTPQRKAVEVDVGAIERQLADAGRTWEDRLAQALMEAKGEAAGMALLQRYGKAFPTAYREAFSGAVALYDIARIEEVRAGQTPLALTLYKPVEAEPHELRFKIYRAAEPVPLSDVLPMLENLGLKVISEEPYRVTPAGDATPVAMQDFALVCRVGVIDVARDRQRFEQAFARLWAGEMESDGFNRLILGACLDWRQVTILRLYAKALRQAGSAFSQAYMEDTFAAHPDIAAKLVRLFQRRFNPERAAVAQERSERLATEIEHDLDAVTNLDEDRILRSFLTLIRKSLRTNYFQRLPSGAPKPYLSVKLASHEIDLLPLPRPLYEIFVYGARMEGVHLRGGKVARGGIRWSDRKEDFRTEVLGLMKAQMVKNAVIVPVGSKGGFVVKRPPPGGRDALMKEVVACYQTLMHGLLDVTDNIVGDKIVPPERVVRHDDDDPYLVVAADKGTATFSDIANGVSEGYGFWLADAFASGGSQGYDHKAIGITARGAWELVKRHFREIGTDIQAADFTCVGVGDMSGDVFGNGMLRSKHTKMIAAFDHRHVFLDPDPDPEKSFAERQRLFDLPRSSWADYDKKLVSKGGGIFERTLKSIPLSPEIRAKLGIKAERLTPAEVMKAILKAEVDLLWFGGIGTYIKASTESHGDAGDRGNDAIRIDATQIRAKVVGEGANLGVTQHARIEYALKGGRINTDAIDNSAGVDTSDHEVNLKILLNAAVSAGDLTMKQRNQTLRERTDDVAAHVLRDNYLQGLALTLAESQAAERLDAEARLMREMEKVGKLDRAVEFLPDESVVAQRRAAERGLVRPEHAVLMAYVKNTLAHELTATDLPDDPHLKTDLLAYFPPALVERFRPQIEAHRLRREIIATCVANELVNRCGITFVADMIERTGRGAGDTARAYGIVRGVYDLDGLWAEVTALDNQVPAAVQTEMLLAANRLVERTAAWFLRAPGALDIAGVTQVFKPGVAALAARLGETLPASQKAELARRIAGWQERGVPAALAERIAKLDFLVSAVDIVKLAVAKMSDVAELGRRFFAVGSRFRLDLLRMTARKLAADTAWRKLAIGALIEDLYGHQADLTARAVAEDDSGFEAWINTHAAEVSHLDSLVTEILQAPAPDLAMLTVANRHLRALVAT